MKPSQKEGRGFHRSHRPRVEEEEKTSPDQGGSEQPTEPVLADGRESIRPTRRSLLAKLMMWRAPPPASGLCSGLCVDLKSENQGFVWRGGIKNVQIETQPHLSVLPSAHMTATSKYTICSSQCDEERSEAEMKNTTTAA